MLFEVTPYDPVTFVVVAVTFFTVAAVGMLVPTRRAARLNPVAALRHD
jgi:ABC-type antimicrobial peptide transport system permease subunit